MKALKKPREINISEFKTQILSLIEETRKFGREYILLKHGRPIARVIPFDNNSKTSFMDLMDSLKGKLRIQGDIVNINSESDWEALK